MLLGRNRQETPFLGCNPVYPYLRVSPTEDSGTDSRVNVHKRAQDWNVSYFSIEYLLCFHRHFQIKTNNLENIKKTPVDKKALLCFLVIESSSCKIQSNPMNVMEQNDYNPSRFHNPLRADSTSYL